MKVVIKKCNELIGNADSDNYDSVSYNKYFRDLTSISTLALEETSKLRVKIMELPDTELRSEILKLI